MLQEQNKGLFRFSLCEHNLYNQPFFIQYLIQFLALRKGSINIFLELCPLNILFFHSFVETTKEILNENEDDIFKNGNKKFEVKTNLFNFYNVILQIR